jgi:hypothetical protein
MIYMQSTWETAINLSKKIQIHYISLYIEVYSDTVNNLSPYKQ